MDLNLLLWMLQQGAGGGDVWTGEMDVPEQGSYDIPDKPLWMNTETADLEGEGMAQYLPYAKGALGGVKGIAGLLMGQAAAREEEERRKKQEALQRAAMMSRNRERAGGRWGY